MWRIATATRAATQIGTLPGPCSPSGIAFGPDGRLYVTGGNAPASDTIFVLRPGTAATTATVFATGVPAANGLAFDRRGTLWASDGGNAQGIVYRIAPSGGAGVEAFRIPPMTNRSASAGRTARCRGSRRTRRPRRTSSPTGSS